MRITSLRLKGVGPFEDTTIEFPEGKRADLADVYLLVGRNGCGKTTALHALASALLANGHAQNLHERFRPNADAGVLLRSEPTGLWGYVQGSGDWILDRNSFRSQPAWPGVQAVFAAVPEEWTEWRNFSTRTTNPIRWAGFAFSGNRQTNRVQVSSIADLGERQLQQALDFRVQTDTQRLGQWVANQRFRRLQAKEANRPDLQRSAEQALKRIEMLVSEILGETFEFSFSLADLNVRTVRNGIETEFHLLPEGAQSIVSWVGDLLMRLDELWAAHGDPMLRSFLLLLDEIDVHLHPAWQRRLLPAVQRAFPNAQIIASTHSPFVVASLKDGAVIELALDDKGTSVAQVPVMAPLDMSYSTTMRSLFGIESDFDPEVEADFRSFQAAGARALKGEPQAEQEFMELGTALSARSEELAQMVRFEINQNRRQRAAK